MQLRANAGAHYRHDIDGLRAVAILCVVFNHASVPGFASGFLGVDLFFTISGFLVFSILCGEHEAKGQIDWIIFFARRIRRLIPEATVMIVAIMIAGYFMLLPLGEQQKLAKSGIAAALWGANIFFWKVGYDYFAPSTEYQPLLHLWSLGVEEQFYLLVPVIFFAANQLSGRRFFSWRQTMLIVLAVIGAISLGGTVLFGESHPAAAFYLLPTRVYEFVVGALAAVLIIKERDVTAWSTWRMLLSHVGIAGIGVSVFLYRPEFRHPGAWTLLPTISTAILLWAGAFYNPQIVGRLLGLRPMVFLGKISYGWYLWHWPLLALLRGYLPTDPNIWIDLAIVVVALIPATVGHHLVSNIRKKSAVTPAPLYRGSAFRFGATALLATVCASGALGAHARYVAPTQPAVMVLKAQRSDMYQPDSKCTASMTKTATEHIDCAFGDVNGDVTIVLWGDSHANHWVPALDPIFRDLKIRGVERWKSGCPPGLTDITYKETESLRECFKFNIGVIQEIIAARGSRRLGIILSARWSLYVNNQPLSIMDRAFKGGHPRFIGGEVMAKALDTTVTTLGPMDIPVGIMLQVPEQKFDVPVCVSRWRVELCQRSEVEGRKYHDKSKELVTKIAAVRDAIVFDPIPLLCRGGICRVTDNGVLLYHDDDHLSKTGAHSLKDMPKIFVQKIHTRMEGVARSFRVRE